MAAQPPAPITLAQSASDRLRRGQGASFFTSDLSVDEFLLTREAGFESLGMVMGSSIYHIGFQVGSYNQNMELGILSQAMNNARSLAMQRMEAEADALGADGVAGLRFQIGMYEWGENMAEFVAIGTALKAREGSFRTPAGKPFTSSLSGQDLYKLIKGGFAPVSLVFGVCVYHVYHLGLRQMMKTAMQNIEMPNYTQALYDARELALDRMQYEAMQRQAQGCVGVLIQEQPWYWGSHVIEFFALGTAVRAYAAGEPPKPQLAVTMNG
jgi:uncharacterized protein YbjQ (UPF0145 family)